MRALVIGGTGMIGNHVVRALLSEGIAVRAFSRGITPTQNLDGLDVEIFRGDLNDMDSLRTALIGCSWVFHTAPYYPTSAFDLLGHRSRALAGLEQVLNACASTPIERLVYTSTLTTIGPASSASGLANEADVYPCYQPAPHPYFDLKYFMEERVKRAAREGLPVVIVNPTGCFGPYELKPLNLCLVAQIVNAKIPAYVDRPINAVDVADVGRGHVMAAKQGRFGERYILGGHNVTSKILIQLIASIAGVAPPQLEVPLKLALIPAWISEFLSYYILKATPALPLLGLRFIQYGQHIDISKAKLELGYQVSPLEPSLERAVAWFRQIGYC